MQAPSPPPAPDPAATAAAQAKANKETAVAQANMNRINQITPQGRVTYKQIGTNEDGTPQYESTQEYSPEEMAIYQAGTRARQNLSNIAVSQSARIGDLLNRPFDLNSESEARFNDLARKRLDPLWQEKQGQFDQQMANRGISLGSDAYTRAQKDFDQGRNDAYNSMFLNSRSMANQEAIAQRNQPLNEISALMSGSQVSSPNFVGVPQVGVANTDVAGIYDRAYQNNLNAWNMQNNNNNAMMGGIFGLAGTAARFIPWSDRRLKKNIKRIGYADNGLPIYSFTYIWGGPVQLGFMAQDVEKVAPEAVVEVNGFKAVDYERAA